MKLYELKETTPLKFHRFIWFIWMPLSFVVAVVNAWEAIFDFWGYLLDDVISGSMAFRGSWHLGGMAFKRSAVRFKKTVLVQQVLPANHRHRSNRMSCESR